MPDVHGPSVLLQAAIFLAAAVVAVPLFRRLGLGSILGYLAAGVAIGPNGLRFFDDPKSVMHVAEFGVVLFLFLIGLELNLARLWSMRRDIFGVGAGQVIVSGLLMMIFPLVVVGRPWKAALIAGLGLALSSTALVMQVLEEKGETQAPHGEKAFAILLFQDLAVVPLLALVSLLAPAAPGEVTSSADVWLAALRMLAAVGSVVLVGRFLLNPLFRLIASTGAREIMTAAALLLVLAAAGVMTYAGLSPALGAFLAGIMLAESSYRHELEADVEPFRGLLLGLFFISVGMSVDLRLIGEFAGLLLAALLTLTVLKTGVIYGLVRWSGGSHETAVKTGFLLPQGGEFGFVLFSTAVARGVMEQEQATLLIGLVTMSMALSPLLQALVPRLIRAEARTREDEFQVAKGSVLMIGFGRFGQIVSQLLLLEGTEVTAIDNDLEMIEAAEKFGFRVFFGDGSRLDVLRAAGAQRARLICICVEKKEVATQITAMVREAFPLAQIYARAYDRGHALELLERGADYQMRETYESAIVFGRAALEGLELEAERITEIESDFRMRDRERFVLQQQGDTYAGTQHLATRPMPRPEPLVEPKKRGVKITSNA
jgi:monovalent cation:proton antiporter-2 (CPA2) family protein